MGSWMLLFSGWILTVSTVSATWLHRPGHLRHCVGDTVNFNWTYDPSSTEHVSMIFWLSLRTKHTMIGWYDDRNPRLYNGYIGRAYLLEGANAGIVLMNVTEADSGEYQIELSGPGYVDKAELHVYNASSLVPTLTIDGNMLGFGQDFNATTLNTITLSLNTSPLLSANITIHVKGFPTKTCRQEASCTTTLDLLSATTNTTHVTVLVRYHMCPEQQHKYTFNIVTSGSDIGNDVDRRTSLITGIICSLLIVGIAVCVICIVIFIIRRKRTQTNVKNHTQASEIESKSISSAYDNISMREVDVLSKKHSRNSLEQGTSEHATPLIQRNNLDNVKKHEPNELVNMNAGVPFDMYA